MKSDKIYACLVYWHTPATLASQESEAKGHEFKACLSYRVSSRLNSEPWRNGGLKMKGKIKTWDGA